jgi:hypothetical protein
MALHLPLPDDLFSDTSKTEDQIDKQEEDILQGDEKKERLRSLQLRNSIDEEKLTQAKQDRIERLKYAEDIFRFVKNYIKWVVGIFIVYQVLIFCPMFRNVPTSPIVTLLGTTSVIVIGLLATVIRYLFPNHQKNQ